MQSSKVTFENEDGDTLSGIIDQPGGAPRAWALFAHCFTCSKNLKAARQVSQALCDAGIAVLRFDFTGLGQSEGEFASTNFSSNIGDLLAAAAFLSARYEAPSLLVGHSLGGTAVLGAAAGLSSATAVVTIGAPAEPAHVRHLLGDREADLEDQGEADVDLGGRRFRMRRQFLDDLENHDLPESVGELRKALLILHAPLDDIVGIDNASKLFAAARHPKSFVSLDDADHLLANERDSHYAGRVISAWASRYIDAPEHGRAPDGNRDEVVARTGAVGYRTDVLAAGHRLVADEPASVGGTNEGPSPYDLLSAALAACTTMTLRMYADRKKLDLRSITARVSHNKIHAKDCEDCESTEGRIDRFRRTLELDGDLSGSELERLVEIADKCPVHRTLHGEVKIETSRGEPAGSPED